MPNDPTSPSPDRPEPLDAEQPVPLLPIAAAAVDLHHLLVSHDAPRPADRAELDAAHAVLIACHRLLGEHMARARPLDLQQAALLRTSWLEVWRAADRLHSAYHRAPPSPRPAPVGSAICRRHRDTAALLRLPTTPSDVDGRPPPFLP